MSASPLHFRPYRAPADTSFLFSALIGSYERSPWAGCLPQHAAYSIHKASINQLLARGATATMAVNPDDHEQILGFLLYEPGLLHYLFVKSLFRRSGVAASLLANANFDCEQPVLHTFCTPDLKRMGLKLVHKPELARRKLAYDKSTDGRES